MQNNSRAYFESLKSIAFDAISGTYAAVGSPTACPVRAFCITNNTQGDMIFSTDNTDASGHMFIAQGSYKLYDVQANQNAQFDDKYVLPTGTQFYVKQDTAPVDGAVYVEIMY